MGDRVTDPQTGKTYEIYNAYRESPWFHAKVDVLAEMHGTGPENILSTGKWKEPVPDEQLGL